MMLYLIEAYYRQYATSFNIFIALFSLLTQNAPFVHRLGTAKQRTKQYDGHVMLYVNAKSHTLTHTFVSVKRSSCSDVGLFFHKFTHDNK